METKLHGIVKNGIYPYMQALREALAAFDGKDIVIRISERKKRRSVNQERFYRGVVLKEVLKFEIDAGRTRDDGGDFTLQDAHFWCKKIMGRVEYRLMPDGEWYLVDISNGDVRLTKKQWEEDLEKLRAYYAKEGLQVSFPNEEYDYNSGGRYGSD